jgi:hypothetical protein
MSNAISQENFITLPAQMIDVLQRAPIIQPFLENAISSRSSALAMQPAWLEGIQRGTES